jgi:hypothetical protein
MRWDHATVITLNPLNAYYKSAVHAFLLSQLAVCCPCSVFSHLPGFFPVVPAAEAMHYWTAERISVVMRVAAALLLNAKIGEMMR